MRVKRADIYFDESGDTGDPNRGSQKENFVVGFVYVPEHNYHACLTALQPLLGWSSSSRANEIKAEDSTPAKIERVLQKLVDHDCRFGAMQINKRTAKNYSSFKASSDDKYARTNMILSLLASVVKTLDTKTLVRAHIDRFPATDKERRDLRDYLAYHIAVKLGNTLFAYPRSSHRCLGVRCADHIAYSIFKNTDPQYNHLFDVIENTTITWSEITNANFLKII
ncbi:MAG: DUF3800 domain-containing protein [Halobacteriota archaeon]